MNTDWPPDTSGGEGALDLVSFMFDNPSQGEMLPFDTQLDGSGSFIDHSVIRYDIMQGFASLGENVAGEYLPPQQPSDIPDLPGMNMTLDTNAMPDLNASLNVGGYWPGEALMFTNGSCQSTQWSPPTMPLRIPVAMPQDFVQYQSHVPQQFSTAFNMPTNGPTAGQFGTSLPLDSTEASSPCLLTNYDQSLLSSGGESARVIKGTNQNPPTKLNRQIRHEIRPEKCHICNKGHPYPRELREHIRRQHVAEAIKMNINTSRPVCRACGKSFARPCYLKRHIGKSCKGRRAIRARSGCATN